MNEKNTKLLLPFPVTQLNEDIETQRKHLRDMIEFKERFVTKVETDELLFGENAETGKTEVNDDFFNAVMHLNDNINNIYRSLIDSYSKVAVSSSSMEKAFKENNNAVEDKKGKKSVGKTLFK